MTSAQQPLPKYTMQQVELHNKKDDAWMVIHSKVINITKFAKKHPGGRNILRKNAGKDVTMLFEQSHKREKKKRKANKMMKPYIIGEIMASHLPN